MEPAKLNSSDPADAKLEALLREHATDALPDDGFSQRVMALLPETKPFRRAALIAPRPRLFPTRNPADLWIAGPACAAAMIIAQLSGDLSFSAALRQAETAFAPLIEAANDSSLLLVLGITAGILLLTADEADDAWLTKTPGA